MVKRKSSRDVHRSPRGGRKSPSSGHGKSAPSRISKREGKKEKSARTQKSVRQEDGATSAGGADDQLSDSTEGPEKGTKKLQQITSAEAGGLARAIDEEPFYHGFMTPNECKPLLKHVGDFLVRKTEFNKKMVYALSVCVDPTGIAPVRHFIIKRTRGKQLYHVYGYAFKTISDLTAYHSRLKKPIAKTGECIIKPVRKSADQLNHEQIEKTTKLGEGAFGEVFKGFLSKGVFKQRQEVAIKQLHEDETITMDERIKFLREANVMRKLVHKNIIMLYGVAAAKDPIMIVMELAPGGTLLARVQNKENPPTVMDLTKYSAGAACGLAYLESQDVIHRDVAARNCLLGSDDEAKISDFGLSLISATYSEKALKSVPIRWLAPETLRRGTYSSKSDVWSYGVLMWEVFSYGKVPYEEIEGFKDIRRGILKQTLKLAVLSDMPKELDEVMQSCVQFNPDKRPTFAVLSVKLNEIRRIQRKKQTFAARFRSWKS